VGELFWHFTFSVIIARVGHFVYMQQGILNHQAFEKFVKPLFG